MTVETAVYPAEEGAPLTFADGLPRIKTFLRPARLPASSRGLLTRLIAAFVCRVGPMCAARAAEAVRAEGRHRAALVRFLARRHWSRDWATLTAVAGLLWQAEAGRGGVWYFIPDQTCVGQQGRHTEDTFSRANFRPRAKKGNRKQRKSARRRCHAFVCGLLRTPGGLRIPCCRSYDTEAYRRDRGWDYRTQVELAAALVRAAAVPAGAEAVVRGDTAFEAKDIRQARQERGFGWVVPVHPERVLAGPQPRPKVAALAAALTAEHDQAVRLVPGHGADAAQRRAAPCRLGPKAKARTSWVHPERRAVHHVGDVPLVFPTRDEPRPGRAVPAPKVRMTDRLGWGAAAVVTAYALRWQVAPFFKECKGTLGLGRYRFRRFVQAENWVQACLVAFVYLERLRATRLARADLSEPPRRRWSAQRSHGLSRAAAQQAEDRDLAQLYRRSATATGRRNLRRAVRQALPAEYRNASGNRHLVHHRTSVERNFKTRASGFSPPPRGFEDSALATPPPHYAADRRMRQRVTSPRRATGRTRSSSCAS